MLFRTPFLVALFLTLVGMSPRPPEGQTGSHLQLTYNLDTHGDLSKKSKILTLHSGTGHVVFQGGVVDTDDGLVVWEGQLDRQRTTADVEEGGILLGSAGRTLDGLCYLDDKLYRVGQGQLFPVRIESLALQPLEASSPPLANWADYYLQSVDTRRPDHPITEDQLPSDTTIEAEAAVATPPFLAPGRTTEISLGLVYSRELTEKLGAGVISFPLWHSRLVEALTNWTFRLHNLPLHLKVVGVADSECASTTLDKDLEKLRDHTSGGPYPGLERADVVGWVGRYRQDDRACGLTRGNPVFKGNVQSPAYFTVDHECAIEHFSVAHELGHILGANHQSGQVQDYSLGKSSRGFCSETGSWRTIMAEIPDKCFKEKFICTELEKCREGSTRLPFWSDPERSYLGEVLSTDGADNSRTLRATAPLVAVLAEAAGKRIAVKTAEVRQEDKNGH
jgi:hypothetical protein